MLNPRKAPKRSGFFGLVLLIPLIFAGCAGYTLGPSNGLAAGEKSIQIRPFENRTLEPRLTDAVTSQLRKQIQKDATYRLATHDDGDIIVSGVITNYNRHELSFSPKDELTAQDFRIVLSAQITARERASGKIILDKAVMGFTLIRSGTDLVSAERQALPILAADLARNIKDLLVEGEW